QHARECHERLAKGNRQLGQVASHESRIPTERRTAKTASSRPVPARAAFSDGPSVRVPTVLTSGTARGIASSEKRRQDESPPAAPCTAPPPRAEPPPTPRPPRPAPAPRKAPAATAIPNATHVPTSTRCGGINPPAVTRTGPSRSSVSAPRRASE